MICQNLQRMTRIMWDKNLKMYSKLISITMIFKILLI